MNAVKRSTRPLLARLNAAVGAAGPTAVKPRLNAPGLAKTSVVGSTRSFHANAILRLEGKAHDEFTQKAEADAESDKHEQQQDDDDEVMRTKILDASLQFVPAYGWTRKATEAGAESLGYPTVTAGVVGDLSGNVGIHLIHHHIARSNASLEASMLEQIEEAPGGKVPDVTKFLRHNVEQRLRMNVPYMSRWSEAWAIMNYPVNAPQSVKYGLEMVDAMWHHAGDKSTDLNWYTKRLTLAGIYKSTELVMMRDKSEDFEETWQFLDRRLADHTSLADVLGTPEDALKVLGALGSTFQAFLGVKR